MSDQPKLSDDGKFYWDGQRWAPLPATPFEAAASDPSSEYRRRAGGVAVGLFALLILVIAIGKCSEGGLEAGVTTWEVGSPVVSGTINNTGSACSDPEVTLYLRDHNDAVVRDFTFGAGEIAEGEKRVWHTRLTTLLLFDAPVESGVRSITAGVSCADKH